VSLGLKIRQILSGIMNIKCELSDKSYKRDKSYYNVGMTIKNNYKYVIQYLLIY